MRVRPFVMSALIASAVSALLYASPWLVDRADSPCMPTASFPGKSAVDHEVDSTLGGCYAIRGPADGVVVGVDYYMSDSQFRHDPEVEADTIQTYDQLYSVIWRRLPYNIRRIEIHAKDLFGGTSRISVVTATKLEARFGPRPRSLRILSNAPPSEGERVGAITEPLSWVLISTTGILLAAAATQAARARRSSVISVFQRDDHALERPST